MFPENVSKIREIFAIQGFRRSELAHRQLELCRTEARVAADFAGCIPCLLYIPLHLHVASYLFVFQLPSSMSTLKFTPNEQTIFVRQKRKTRAVPLFCSKSNHQNTCITLSVYDCTAGLVGDMRVALSRV